MKLDFLRREMEPLEGQSRAGTIEDFVIKVDIELMHGDNSQGGTTAMTQRGEWVLPQDAVCEGMSRAQILDGCEDGTSPAPQQRGCRASTVHSCLGCTLPVARNCGACIKLSLIDH